MDRLLDALTGKGSSEATRQSFRQRFTDGSLNGAEVEIEVDEDQMRLAHAAWRRYGKGRHRAQLNMGDCFAYALAKQTGEPLLYKGKDFGHTDIIPAIP